MAELLTANWIAMKIPNSQFLLVAAGEPARLVGPNVRTRFSAQGQLWPAGVGQTWAQKLLARTLVQLGQTLFHLEADTPTATTQLRWVKFFFQTMLEISTTSCIYRKSSVLKNVQLKIK